MRCNPAAPRTVQFIAMQKTLSMIAALCVSGAFPPPSRVVERLGGAEFAMRISRRREAADNGAGEA